MAQELLRRLLPTLRFSPSAWLPETLQWFCSSLPLASQQLQPRTFATAAYSADSKQPHGLPAFAFDLDGCLLKGGRVLDQTRHALDKLCPGGQWRYPVVFLTNGGGMTEANKAHQLANLMQVPVHENQVIMSHSPMRDLVPRLGHHPVLVSGRADSLNVAKSYGFTRVMSSQQLAEAMPAAVPFVSLGSKGDSPHLPLGNKDNPFRAVLVMTDPSNWYLDLQLIIDVLQSRGHPLLSEPPSGAQPVELYFSNPDMLWANEHPRNRLGQGAFAHTVLSLYQEIQGNMSLDLHVKFYGKPNPEPYRLAERLLLQQAIQLGLVEDNVKEAESQKHEQPHHKKHLPFSAIYAVGDNPASDIRGANQAGSPWVSVLVKTGVFQGPGNNCHREPAHISVADVDAAVTAALHRTRMLKYHSMR